MTVYLSLSAMVVICHKYNGFQYVFCSPNLKDASYLFGKDHWKTAR